MWQKRYNSELYHFGIKGMKWGVRRYQNPDGSLTQEGEDRYSQSLSKLYDTNNYNDDYNVSKGTSIFRRSSSINDDFDDNSDKKYTFGYDYDSNDDNFYSQFGNKVTEYKMANDGIFAGKKTLGKAFVDKMLSLEDENEIDAMDTMFYDLTKTRKGESYVENLFAQPYEPSKYLDTLEKIGPDMIGRMIGTQRNDAFDEKMKRKGLRDPDTAANDLGRSIIDRLVDDGYSGMRDYHDYGSNAPVDTPTIVFNPNTTMEELRYWMDRK